ncbi:glycosyltransferase family protein [Motilibacter deserti]|uniref:Peptidase C80 domain-containing protein n=1 Tax=Motilibacter deserti TaxID=2714956 RepID=A0ABX0GYT9_9ACTN|nr:hypothetical protein [Motilibacter deserti]NHC14732.1 hypothetical protein [Motilibacter deserti]
MAYTSESAIDFYNLLAIDYAIQTGGTPPVKLLAAATPAEIAGQPTLYIVAHGLQGSAGHYNADEIAGLISGAVSKHKGVVALSRVVFLTCWAGTSPPGGESVVDAVAKALSSYKGISVRGPKGASILHRLALGGDAVVVDSTRQGIKRAAGATGSGPATTTTAGITKMTNAFAIQAEKRKKYGPSTEEEKAIMDALAQPDIVRRAEAATKATAPFVAKFVRSLDRYQLVIKRGDDWSDRVS